MSNTVCLTSTFVKSSFIGLFGIPLSIGVGITKYRLYEIDRLISRTLSYALLTGLLVGVFVGLVLLDDARAAVLLAGRRRRVDARGRGALQPAAAAGVQRLVDRRFNRARYDAEAAVTAFGSRLRDAVDPETVLRRARGCGRRLSPARARQRLGQAAMTGALSGSGSPSGSAPLRRC